MIPLLSGDCEGRERIRRKNSIHISLDCYAYALCTKIHRGSNVRSRVDGCRLDLPPRRLCLPLTWSSVSRCLSAVHRSPTTAASIGARCHVFSTWLDRDLTCRASCSHPWLCFVL